MPKDVHITHLCIYALHPRYCHQSHLTNNPVRCDNTLPPIEVERLMTTDKFVPTARIISKTTLASAGEGSDGGSQQAEAIQMISIRSVRTNREPSDEVRAPNYGLTKPLMQLMIDRVSPTVRVGIYTSKDPEETATILGITRDEVVKEEHSGCFAIEIPMIRGVKQRKKLFDDSKDDVVEANGPKRQSVADISLGALHTPDSKPLARESKNAVAQATLAWGGSVADASVAVGKAGSWSSPTTDTEAAKAEQKRLKRLRQKESRTPEESQANWKKVKMSEYNTWLRIAAGTYVRVPGDYYESDTGVWVSPPPHVHYDVDHEYTLHEDRSVMQPTKGIKRARVEERMKAVDRTEKDMEESLQSMAKSLEGGESQQAEPSKPSTPKQEYDDELGLPGTEGTGGSQMAEAGSTPPVPPPAVAPHYFPCLNLCFTGIVDTDVKDWCKPPDQLPIDELFDWFQEPHGVNVDNFIKAMVRADGKNLKWTAAMAWLGGNYPKVGVEANEPITVTAAEEGWKAYVVFSINWCWENHERGTFRKSVSHVGGHLADYARGELLARAGAPPRRWVVVHNDCYVHLYKKFKADYIRLGAQCDRLDAWIWTPDAIGDVFEIAVTRMFYNGDPKCIWDLLEIAVWEQKAHEAGEVKANADLFTARSWKPMLQSGSQPAEALPTTSLNPFDDQVTMPSAGSADDAVEDPDYGGGESQQAEATASMWATSSANEEWVAEASQQSDVGDRVAISAAHQTMEATALYTVTVNSGKWSKVSKCGPAGQMEKSPTDIGIMQSKGFQLVCNAAMVGGEGDEATREDMKTLMQKNGPVIMSALKWSNNAHKKVKAFKEAKCVNYSNGGGVYPKRTC